VVRSLLLKLEKAVTNKLTLSLLVIGLLAAGCASERVILLPSADGQPSGVVVRDKGGEILLDQPYAATVRRSGSVSSYKSSPEEVKERFADALAALPPRANSYTVYFEQGSSDTLTPESLLEFDKVKADLAARSAGEIRVIGHTDRVGSVQSNDAFSIKRAIAVRELLVGSGVNPAVIETAGRGEREPLVPTEDEVPEAKNRRVEISVR
jgi:outer membrane protein OmpA-like peptidoglycan-associated protein